MATASIHIDLDDIIDGLSYSERKDLFDSLAEEFIDEEPTLSGAVTPMDTDLLDTLINIWNQRDLLTMEQRALLEKITVASKISR